MMTTENDPTDWKAIALQLGQRVNFAVRNLKAPGMGIVGNFDKPSSEWQHWHEYFADAMDMVPGVTVDREGMKVYRLPLNKQGKAFRDLATRRSAEKVLAELDPR